MPGAPLDRDSIAPLDLVSDEVLANLDGPPEKVRGLPNAAFISQAIFELELLTSPACRMPATH